MTRVIWLLVLLLAIGAGSWLMRGPTVGGTADARVDAATQDPGYVSVDASLVETGDDGQPLYRLQAARIEQQPPSADIVLVEPRVHYQPTEQPAWTMRAERGVLTSAQQRVDLTGSVEARGIAGRQIPLIVRSEQLRVDMVQQTVDSEARVAIDWGRLRLTAQRLHMNVKDGTLRLESDGHGELAR
jgi:LPS export ABC transporter protein LptC